MPLSVSVETTDDIPSSAIPPSSSPASTPLHPSNRLPVNLLTARPPVLASPTENPLPVVGIQNTWGSAVDPALLSRVSSSLQTVQPQSADVPAPSTSLIPSSVPSTSSSAASATHPPPITFSHPPPGSLPPSVLSHPGGSDDAPTGAPTSTLIAAPEGSTTVSMPMNPLLDADTCLEMSDESGSSSDSSPSDLPSSNVPPVPAVLPGLSTATTAAAGDADLESVASDALEMVDEEEDDDVTPTRPVTPAVGSTAAAKSDSQSTEEAMAGVSGGESGSVSPTVDDDVTPMNEDEEEEDARSELSSAVVAPKGTRDDVVGNKSLRSSSMAASGSGDMPSSLDPAAEPVQRLLRPAVWKQGGRAGSQPRGHGAAMSPRTTYDFVEDQDEVRSESGSLTTERRSGRGRGRGGRGRGTGSGSCTPNNGGVGGPEKRKAGGGRGRGGRRGRGGNHAARVAEALTEALAASTVEDVYDFRGSPESEGADDGSRERSAPPGSKRLRLTEQADPDSNAGSNHSADVEMYEADEDYEGPTTSTRAGGRKVPPLRISLKTPSEEDPMEAAAPARQTKTVGRGRIGKKGQGEQDDAQRMTRSKVRQTGKGLDDVDQWSKKKRGGRSVAPAPYIREEEEPLMDGSASPGLLNGVGGAASLGAGALAVVDPALLTDVSAAQKVILQAPHNGVVSMKKAMAERWVRDALADEAKTKERGLPDRYRSMALYTADYPLASVRPELDETERDYKIPAINGDMVTFWLEQEKQRRSLSDAMSVELVRLRLSAEEELIRLERRLDQSAPLMSAVRLFRESNMCNPLILDEPVPPPPLSTRELFDEKITKRIQTLHRRHRMEAESLCAHQRDLWVIESRRHGFAFDKDGVANCVPLVLTQKLELSLPS